MINRRWQITFCLLLAGACTQYSIGQSAGVCKTPHPSGGGNGNLQKPKSRYLAPVEPIVDNSHPASSVLLTGGIEHSESLPPVQSKLNVGATYDEKKLEKPPAMRDWYKVPPWLAGTWESDTQTTILVVDYKTGKSGSGATERNHGVARYGKQRDRAGGVWDYVSVPEQVESDSNNFLNKDLTTRQVVMKNSNTQLVIKDLFTRRLIDKSTRKIVKVTQMEQISCLAPAGRNQIKLFGSLKAFDQNGKKLGLIDAAVVYKRKEAFQKCDYDKVSREDLRPSFGLYLEKHGMAHLIPKDL